MTYCLVVVGWDCAHEATRTLQSIQDQACQDWRVQIVVDHPTGDTGDVIRRWCDSHDDRWQYRLNRTRRYAVRNQVEAINLLAPADDDVIVWLDLDGDRLAHPLVLDRVADEYQRGALLTYGSYRPTPEPPWAWPRARPFSPKVIARNGYREAILRGHAYFNHLRTMSGLVYRHIPPDHFRWKLGPDAGQWYDGGSDYIFMCAGLELAGPRHAFIPDVLLVYNHDQPHPDYIERGTEARACSKDYLGFHDPLPMLPRRDGDPPLRVTMRNRTRPVRAQARR